MKGTFKVPEGAQIVRLLVSKRRVHKLDGSYVIFHRRQRLTTHGQPPENQEPIVEHALNAIRNKPDGVFLVELEFICLASPECLVSGCPRECEWYFEDWDCQDAPPWALLDALQETNDWSWVADIEDVLLKA